MTNRHPLQGRSDFVGKKLYTLCSFNTQEIRYIIIGTQPEFALAILIFHYNLTRGNLKDAKLLYGKIFLAFIKIIMPHF